MLAGHPGHLTSSSVPLRKALPEKHQPENWLVKERQWQLVEELSIRSAAKYLKEVVISGPILLEDKADSLDWDWIQVNGVNASLGIVKVRPNFYVNPWGTLRAEFALRKTLRPGCH